MKFLIISGMSGAGKTRAADVLEDMDYYCVDNMPAALLPKLAEFCLGMGGRYEKVAPPVLMTKPACFSLTCAPPIVKPLRPASSISAAA